MKIRLCVNGTLKCCGNPVESHWLNKYPPETYVRSLPGQLFPAVAWKEALSFTEGRVFSGCMPGAWNHDIVENVCSLVTFAQRANIVLVIECTVHHVRSLSLAKMHTFLPNGSRKWCVIFTHARFTGLGCFAGICNPPFALTLVHTSFVKQFGVEE